MPQRYLRNLIVASGADFLLAVVRIVHDETFGELLTPRALVLGANVRAM